MQKKSPLLLHTILLPNGKETKMYEITRKYEDALDYFMSERMIPPKAVSSRDALLGKFEKTDGKKAVFFSLLDYQSFAESTLCFELDESKHAYLCKSDNKEKLSPDADGIYRVTLNGLEACFITVD